MSREIFPVGAFLRFPQRGAGFSGLLRRKSAGSCLELFQVMESPRLLRGRPPPAHGPQRESNQEAIKKDFDVAYLVRKQKEKNK